MNEPEAQPPKLLFPTSVRLSLTALSGGRAAMYGPSF
jgi:hypothetical protein